MRLSSTPRDGSKRLVKAFLTVLSVSNIPYSTTVCLCLSQNRLTHCRAEYHSWNAGPRSCLGRALATYEGLAISTAILQRFDVSLADETRTYEPLAALNMVCHMRTEFQQSAKTPI